uniref:Uncharacterized protein n=1 Tax=uncultured marine group II/III euryarchaeote KM3_193_A06 TaxID=1457966 RepID=A0A075GW67_9EURY|nr:hypothetical protein [uncultured marine group II/III euryarchaeote KM3_193_A06]
MKECDFLTLSKLQKIFRTEVEIVKQKRISIEVRPEGKHVPLENKMEGLSIALGVAPSPTDIESKSFLKLIGTYADKSHSIPCLQNDSLGVLVNRRSCLWCQNNTTCKEMEYSNTYQKVLFKIYSEPSDSDKQTVINFIKSDELSTKTEIFHNQIDPFKPFFDISKERTIRIFPLENSVVFQPTLSSCWGHIFYCPPLLRTMTLLEAQVIDFLPINRYDREADDDTPYGHEFNLFLKDEFGQLEKHFFIKLFKEKLLQAKDDESSKWYDLYNLLNQTQTNLPSGLYNEKVELNHNLSFSGDVFEVIATFLWELWVKVNSSPIFQDQQIVEERANAIILYPRQNNSVEIRGSTKIVRLIPLEGIAKPWIIIDGDSAFQYLPNRLSSAIPSYPIDTTFHQKYKSPPPVLSRMFKSYRRPKQLLHWNSGSSDLESPLNRISWFPPDRLIAALSMNSVLRSNVANVGGTEFRDYRDMTIRFLVRFFRKSSIWKNSPEIQKYKKDLKNFVSIIQNPTYLKSEPYKLLYEVCQHNGRVVSNLMTYNRIEKRSEHIIQEEFVLENPFSLNSGAKIIFKRIIEMSGFGQTEKIHPFKAISTGNNRLTDSHLAEQVCRALDWTHTPSDISKNSKILYPSNGGIWISKDMDRLLRKGDENSLELSDAIAKRSRTRTHHCVMFVSTEQEMRLITPITGEIGPTSEYFKSPSMVIWETPMAAKEASPNFFFAGKII